MILVPEGDHSENPDKTRNPEWYDGIYNYLKEIGLKRYNPHNITDKGTAPAGLVSRFDTSTEVIKGVRNTEALCPPRLTSSSGTSRSERKCDQVRFGTRAFQISSLGKQI